MQDRLPPMASVLTNKSVLLSVGPMRTSVDAVRFIQNRSSGAMGLALAQALRKRGARVTILLGPVGEAQNQRFSSFDVTPYETATDYARGLERLFPACDIFFSVAAVLDFEVQATEGKWAREELGNTLSLPITPVKDFAAWAGQNKRRDQQVIAFAVEAGDDLLSRAEAKRAKKNADAMVANPVSQGLGPEADQNEVWVLRPGQQPVHLGPAPKEALAGPLLDALFGKGA
jgi:phosphopantothenoylcysteine decarboxylase / phosphopantothenate---cysteine ligase